VPELLFGSWRAVRPRVTLGWYRMESAGRDRDMQHPRPGQEQPVQAGQPRLRHERGVVVVRRCLVVANRTLLGAELRAQLRKRIEAGASSFICSSRTPALRTITR